MCVSIVLRQCSYYCKMGWCFLIVLCEGACIRVLAGLVPCALSDIMQAWFVSLQVGLLLSIWALQCSVTFGFCNQDLFRSNVAIISVACQCSLESSLRMKVPLHCQRQSWRLRCSTLHQCYHLRCLQSNAVQLHCISML